MNAVVYVPTGATVNINSQLFYQNGEYVNSEKTVDVDIVVIAL